MIHQRNTEKHPAGAEAVWSHSSTHASKHTITCTCSKADPLQYEPYIKYNTFAIYCNISTGVLSPRLLAISQSPKFVPGHVSSICEANERKSKRTSTTNFKHNNKPAKHTYLVL